MKDEEIINQLKNKIAELFIVRASGHAFDDQREFPLWELKNKDLKYLLEIGIGGVILLGGTTSELKQRCKQLKEWSSKSILICADIEEGLGQRFPGGTHLVPPIAIGRMYKDHSSKAIEYAEKYGQCIAREAKECGLNWILAPVCDINNNYLNPVINVRSWGEKPQQVSDLISSFQKGISSEGLLSCAKHFPGHGDTLVDSHLDLPVINHSLKRLNEFELVPFLSAIESGVGSIMTGHILMESIDEEYPASLSYEINTKLLREEIGYEGLIVTDAMVMKSIGKYYGNEEAALMAFSAGADLIMMPENPYKAIQLFLDAVLSEKISQKRLDQSLFRRRRAIQQMLINTKSSIDRKDNIYCSNNQIIRDNKFSNDLLNDSIELKNSGDLLIDSTCINLIRIDSLFSEPKIHQDSPALALFERFNCKTVVYNPLCASIWSQNSRDPLSLDRIGDGPIFLQLFIRGNPFKGSLSEQEPWGKAIKQLQRKNLLKGLIIYGSPYLWEELDDQLSPSTPAAYSPAQTHEAQDEVLKKLFQVNPKNRNIINNDIDAFTN
tara:strand:+ start:3088 stop:4740 length:1653 start_codon:yes stop_codon:yes gene_type:complete